MNDEHKALVKGRAAAREAANELAKLYLDESFRIKQEHGLDAAITFLEALRDNLVEIRPFPIRSPQPVKTPTIDVSGADREWDEDDLPDRYRLVEFNAECEAQTDLAVKIGDDWIPKSQLLEVPEVGDYIESWPVTEWFADKL